MTGPKAENIEKMFDSIAGDYDSLNHILSLDMDKTWRKRALKKIIDRTCPQKILDLACGTGDFSIEIARHICEGSTVRGLDLSAGMLDVMREKLRRSGLEKIVGCEQGNGECLPFEDGEFDVVTIAFGIRNFEHREAALREILRVLRPGGRLVILELSIPAAPGVDRLYKFYFTKILPLVGGRVSGDKAAYRYLPASVMNFPGKKEWMATMESCGFGNVSHKAFSFGICRMYVGEKAL